MGADTSRKDNGGKQAFGLLAEYSDKEPWGKCGYVVNADGDASNQSASYQRRSGFELSSSGADPVQGIGKMLRRSKDSGKK